MKRSPFFYDIVAQDPILAAVQGWEVPNQFTTPEEEHRAVRERVGMFDWSTTGEFEVQGPDALALVQKLIVNDVSQTPIHRVLYTSILGKGGGIRSDITVYRLGQDHYMLMTAWGSNAANERPEFELLMEQGKGMQAAITDVSVGGVGADTMRPSSSATVRATRPLRRTTTETVPSGAAARPRNRALWARRREAPSDGALGPMEARGLASKLCPESPETNRAKSSLLE